MVFAGNHSVSKLIINHRRFGRANPVRRYTSLGLRVRRTARTSTMIASRKYLRFFIRSSKRAGRSEIVCLVVRVLTASSIPQSRSARLGAPTIFRTISISISISSHRITTVPLHTDALSGNYVRPGRRLLVYRLSPRCLCLKPDLRKYLRK